jgi:hypothetical protein
MDMQDRPYDGRRNLATTKRVTLAGLSSATIIEFPRRTHTHTFCL